MLEPALHEQVPGYSMAVSVLWWCTHRDAPARLAHASRALLPRRAFARALRVVLRAAEAEVRAPCDERSDAGRARHHHWDTGRNAAELFDWA